jgi:hypothetical protein
MTFSSSRMDCNQPTTFLNQTLIGARLINKFLCVYGNRKVIILFIRVKHWILPWGRWDQSTASHVTFLLSILILSSDLDITVCPTESTLYTSKYRESLRVNNRCSRATCQYYGTLTALSAVSRYCGTFFYLVCEAIGTTATPGLLCQPRVIVKMIMEKQNECRLAGETGVLGENLPQRTVCPSQNPTWPYQGLNPGRRSGKRATNGLSYGAPLLWYLIHCSVLPNSYIHTFTSEVWQGVSI